MGAAGKYVEANAAAAAAALFGVGRRRISGKPAGSFTRHEASEEFGRRLFATLAESGALHSTAVVKRPDGEEWSIEFHMRPMPAADGYVVVMRRIQEARCRTCWWQSGPFSQLPRCYAAAPHPPSRGADRLPARGAAVRVASPRCASRQCRHGRPPGPLAR